MDPQENQAPAQPAPEPQPVPASEPVQAAPVEAPAPEEAPSEEKSPVSFSWKKPIIWMVVIGVVALGIWLVAGYL
ncbi:MAG: hypothetical protein ABIA11_02410 [Patescibacteria group bacterium]|nr:hypothetical protein [Patescibacteria group bacterium]